MRGESLKVRVQIVVLVPEILSRESGSDENSLNWTMPWPRTMGNWSDWFTDLFKIFCRSS